MKLWIEAVSRERWVSLAERMPDFNYRHQWQYGVAIAERVGARSEHVAIIGDDSVVGLADVRCKYVPLMGGGIAYINGGPLTGRSGHGWCHAFRSCLEALRSHYCHSNGMVLRVAPALRADVPISEVSAVYAEAGFAPVPSASPYRTIAVDISRPRDQIRTKLAQKWRNCLNRAERNGLEIRSGSAAGLMDEFVRLYGQLLSRKRFDAELDAAFYQSVHRASPPNERPHIAIAYHKNVPAAGIVASILGDTAVYLLGASNELGMQQKAAYVLQWHVIEQAKAAGCQWYDLGGIDPEANPGVYHFKEGMGGIDVTAPCPFELRPGGLRGRLTHAAERAYRWLRKRRAGRTIAAGVREEKQSVSD